MKDNLKFVPKLLYKYHYPFPNIKCKYLIVKNYMKNCFVEQVPNIGMTLTAEESLNIEVTPQRCVRTPSTIISYQCCKPR